MPPEKTPRRKPATVPMRQSIKTSLILDGDLHTRIAAAASMRRVSHSALCVEILRDALRSIVVFDRDQKKSHDQVSPSDGEDRADVA